MKRLSIIIAVLFTSLSAFCQSKINIDSVMNHIGEKVTLCSKVYGTKALEKVTFINLGAEYPNSSLTLVIFSQHRSNFKEAPEVLYADKNICVTGVPKEYDGKAEIIVTLPGDINVQWTMDITLYEFNSLNEFDKGAVLWDYDVNFTGRFDQEEEKLKQGIIMQRRNNVDPVKPKSQNENLNKLIPK